jgi:sulfur carrier protein
MQIIVNGQEKKYLGNEISLSQVLEDLSLVGKVMAAAVNMDIIKQNDWEKYTLKDGDKLELLDFVGGG